MGRVDSVKRRTVDIISGIEREGMLGFCCDERCKFLIGRKKDIAVVSVSIM